MLDDAADAHSVSRKVLREHDEQVIDGNSHVVNDRREFARV